MFASTDGSEVYFGLFFLVGVHEATFGVPAVARFVVHRLGQYAAKSGLQALHLDCAA
jgi:hypothetical protein